MNFPKTSRVTTLLGTASLLAIAQAEGVYAAEVVAQADEIPETVLITGSLIRGTTAVGVPVVNLSPQDFAMTGAITASDLFRTIPQFNVNPGPVSTQGNNRQRGVRVNLRQLDTTDALRSLMMVDGMRYPPQSEELSTIDPSILPTSAIERIDLLLDGASATYGSDAIGGVINIILKRNYDGAMLEAGFTAGKGGNIEYLASGTWGRTWDGGQVTLSYRGSTPLPRTETSTRSSPLTTGLGVWTTDARSAPQPLARSPLAARSVCRCRTQTIRARKFRTRFTRGPSAPTARTATPSRSAPASIGHAGASGVGPLLPGSAPTLNWANLSDPSYAGTNGTRNVFNPFSIVDYSAATQYTGGAITVDQRLTSNISFYGSGFYGMRRSQIVINDAGHQLTWAVPTWNPYYPTGAPKICASPITWVSRNPLWAQPIRWLSAISSA